MKILIIANMRSGSTTLLKWLGKELGYNTINELHNPIFPGNFDLNTDNFIVKEMYHHIKDIKDYKSNFDIVITLTRNDTYDSAISLLFCHEKTNYDYHSKYKINDNWIEGRIDEIYRIQNEFIIQNNEITNLNEFHITYEGIFQTKSDIKRVCDYVGLNYKKLKAEELINNINRYRNNNKLI